MQQKLHSLNISGSGSSGGGEFENVKISGSGNIIGNVKCNDFKTSGSSKVSGDIECINLKVSGSSKIEGNVKCENFKVSGSTKVVGNIEGNNIAISGSTNVEGSLNINNITISGSFSVTDKMISQDIKCSGDMKVENDIECENIEVSGCIKSNGLINCENFKLYRFGNCRCNEIGATNIEIKKDKKYRLNIIGNIISKLFKVDTFHVKVIEGDNIYIENCNAQVVRGNKVVIGKNCNIKKVEYTDQINISDKSKVENCTKM